MIAKDKKSNLDKIVLGYKSSTLKATWPRSIIACQIQKVSRTAIVDRLQCELMTGKQQSPDYYIQQPC